MLSPPTLSSTPKQTLVVNWERKPSLARTISRACYHLASEAIRTRSAEGTRLKCGGRGLWRRRRKGKGRVWGESGRGFGERHDGGSGRWWRRRRKDLLRIGVVESLWRASWGCWTMKMGVTVWIGGRRKGKHVVETNVRKTIVVGVDGAMARFRWKSLSLVQKHKTNAAISNL